MDVNRRTPLHFRQWRSWLRGADLNRRPLGYASDSPFDESRTVPSSTRDARRPVSTPSPYHSWGLVSIVPSPQIT